MRGRQAIFAAGILFMTVLAGCGKESLETIMTDTQKNIKEVSSVTGDLDMDLEMKVGRSGISMGLDMGLEGDWETVTEPAAFHFDGTLNISLMKFSMDIELYGVEEDGKMILYTKAADKWSRTESSLEDTHKDQNTEDIFEAKDKSVTLEDETEKVGNKEVYVLRTSVSGDDITNMLKAVEAVADKSLDKVDLSALEVEVSSRIYKEDKLPASFTVDLKDGLSNLVPEDDPSGVQVGIEKCIVTVNAYDYNNINEISIPQEALEAENISGSDFIQDLGKGITEDDSKEDDMNFSGDIKKPEQTADGSYILSDFNGNTRAGIKVPEGFEEDYLIANYLSFSKTEGDKYMNATYNVVGLDTYYTEEDYIKGYLLQENGYEEYGYKEFKCEGPFTFKIRDREIKCMTLMYTFDEKYYNYSIELWEKMENGDLLQCSISEGSDSSTFDIKPEERLAEIMFSGVTYL